MRNENKNKAKNLKKSKKVKKTALTLAEPALEGLGGREAQGVEAAVAGDVGVEVRGRGGACCRMRRRRKEEEESERRFSATRKRSRKRGDKNESREEEG